MNPLYEELSIYVEFHIVSMSSVSVAAIAHLSILERGNPHLWLFLSFLLFLRKCLKSYFFPDGPRTESVTTAACKNLRAARCLVITGL